jgi:catechol 2,3-dioxygenase-like lactoylglutathione lyase family enzyme
MVKQLRVALTVDDLDAALAFYRDTLGLEMGEMWVADDSRSVTSERLVAAGAELLGGPFETPWQDINVRLVAPDGMQLTLFTRA